MKKFFYFLLWPFNRLYDLIYDCCSSYEANLIKVDEHKKVYLVFCYYLSGGEYDICSVCDSLDLAENFASLQRKLGKYSEVSVVDYTLNNLYVL